MDSNRLGRMGRRRFIKSAGSVGITAATLRYGTQEAIAKQTDDNEVAYVHAMRTVNKEPGEAPEREPIYRRAPRNDWERSEATKKAAHDIAKQIRENWGHESPLRAFHSPADTTSGWQVKVHYETVRTHDGRTESPDPSKEEVREKLPDEATGRSNGRQHSAPVRVVETYAEEAACTDCDSSDGYGENVWDDIPGGAAINCPDNLDSSGNPAVGTVAGSFFDTSQDRATIIVSGHVAPQNTYDIEQVTSHCADVYEVTHNSSGIDYAVCRVRGSDGYSVNSGIGNVNNNPSSGTDYSIDGLITNDSLKQAMNNPSNYNFKTQGRGSDRIATGDIAEMGVEDFLGPYYNDVRSTHQVDCGDSGGPLFYVSSSGGAYIGGVIYKKLDPNTLGSCDDAASTTAETVENQAGGSWF